MCDHGEYSCMPFCLHCLGGAFILASELKGNLRKESSQPICQELLNKVAHARYATRVFGMTRYMAKIDTKFWHVTRKIGSEQRAQEPWQRVLIKLFCWEM
jgi:hypothetical protein